MALGAGSVLGMKLEASLPRRFHGRPYLDHSAFNHSQVSCRTRAGIDGFNPQNVRPAVDNKCERSAQPVDNRAARIDSDCEGVPGQMHLSSR